MEINLDELKIVHYPEPVLREICRPIENIDQQVIDVAHRMIEIMKEAPGSGLAAPQVGIPWRMFVTDEPDVPELGARVYINPKITFLIDEPSPFEEGCLSIPKLYMDIMRPGHVKIEALDLEGNTYIAESNERMARVWQHEYDHLDGVLILDRMRMVDRLRLKKKIHAMEDIYVEEHPEAAEQFPRKEKKKKISSKLRRKKRR